MTDKERVSKNIPLRGLSDFFYKPYGFFNRVNIRLGKAATKAFMDLEEFLHKEIFPSPVEGILHKVSEKIDEKAQKLIELSKMVTRSNEILASATAVFPFDLFPDTVTLDRTKVTITKRTFFWSAEVISIRIEDILNVSTGVGPFFGSVTIASRVMSTVDHFKIDYFWRKDAIELKHMIQGYVIALHNKIEVDHLPKQDLRRTLAELGHDNNA